MKLTPAAHLARLAYFNTGDDEEALVAGAILLAARCGASAVLLPVTLSPAMKQALREGGYQVGEPLCVDTLQMNVTPVTW